MPIHLLGDGGAETLRALVNGDPEFALVSRDMALNLCLVSGPDETLLRFRDGKLAYVGRFAPQTEAIDVYVRGAPEFWRLLLSPVPPPGHQNLYAGLRFKKCEVAGNSELYFAFYAAITRMIELMHERANHGAPPAPRQAPAPRESRFEAATGRYVYIDVQGVEYRVYFEEAGAGIPMVCQHTAGSDGQQFRRFLEDPDITARFRVVVPDLPWHGKSQPPEGVAWWATEYRLTRAFFVEFHLAFKRALGLDRPVIIGSSMGGSIATDLAHDAPDDYRAAIALEEGLRASRASEADKLATFRYYRHPRVNGGDRAGASMYCLSGPNSPREYRHEVSWGYSQCAPGVFAGDLFYRHVEHDMESLARHIDTSRCPVYILNGEYDPGTGIPEGEELAAHIKDAKFIPLPGMGHFPMTEDFQKMKPVIMPVLEEIASRG